ncbi:MAG: hypothetical protein ACREQ5_00380 [Candidatus Dormibacteria bacterium]
MTGPTITLLSLGAGVQSTTLALLAVEGKLPKLDAAIFADTGWEPATVYEHLARLGVVLAEAGVPLHRVSAGNLRGDLINPVHRYASVPYFVRNPDGSDGIGRRQCTSEYKLRPINRKVRELLGATPPKFRSVPRGRVAEQWIGFSTDEVHRVSDRVSVLYQAAEVSAVGAGTRSEWGERQGDLLDLLAEEGDPDGCSPYGCRSGVPVGAS